jgi:hypothetical protein
MGVETELKQKQVRIAEYTLPLQEKQIQQSKLEAAVRKEATSQNAEAAAQARLSTARRRTNGGSCWRRRIAFA